MIEPQELNWTLQMKHAVRTLNEAADFLNINIPEDMYEVEEEYPLMISRYYLDLVDRMDPFNDPVWKMSMPDVQELLDERGLDDPLGEEPQTPVPRLIHKYRDRVVIYTSNRCPMLCRFCFRKRKWKTGNQWADISDQDIERIIDYLTEHTEVREILISGGDALMLSNSRLDYLLGRLSSLDSIDAIRIATRVPVTLPMRVDNELAEILANYSNVWLVTHFNHPKELTELALDACKKIVRSGVPMLNQTVLLKGVNDSADTLEELFRALVKNRVKPHYLFHVDPMKGATHFATGVKKGIDIIRSFRTTLGSIAIPHFAIDLPDGGGKVALQPDYKNDDGSFVGINGKPIHYYGVDIDNE